MGTCFIKVWILHRRFILSRFFLDFVCVQNNVLTKGKIILKKRSCCIEIQIKNNKCTHLKR